MHNTPVSSKAEMALIGALINDPVLLDEVVITEKDFYYQKNADMFVTLMQLKHSEAQVEMVGILEKQGANFDAEYFHEVTTLGMNTFAFKQWEKIVIEKSVCRQQIEVAQRIIEKASQSEDASSLFKEEFNTHLDGELVGMEDIIVETMDHITDYLDGRAKHGIPSKIKGLDHFIGGFVNGDIYYLGARPSMGKTAFALQIIKNIAEQDKKIAFFSLEMSKRELGKRLLVNEARVHLNFIKERRVEEEQLARMNKAASHLITTHVSISDKGGQTVESILAKARRHQKKHGLDILFIDHFHIIEDSERGLSANQSASYKSRMLKYMAKELNVPIVCLVQLNRKLEERPVANRMPIMSDIRDSGSLEQDADVVIFLNRTDYWYKDDPDYTPDNSADIKVAKHRDGETGLFRMRFYGGTQRFENY